MCASLKGSVVGLALWVPQNLYRTKSKVVFDLLGRCTNNMFLFFFQSVRFHRPQCQSTDELLPCFIHQASDASWHYASCRGSFRVIFWIHFLRCIRVVSEFHLGSLVHFRFRVGLLWFYFGFRVSIGAQANTRKLQMATDHTNLWFWHCRG